MTVYTYILCSKLDCYRVYRLLLFYTGGLGDQDAAVLYGRTDVPERSPGNHG